MSTIDCSRLRWYVFGVSKPLGSLEERIMGLLWQSHPLTVREVAKRLGDKLAYTTIMTTLDRLFKKGLLAREKSGLAWVYEPAMSRAEFHQSIVEATLGELLQESTVPVLSAFVDTAARLDAKNLRRLEELIAKHRGNKK